MPVTPLVVLFGATSVLALALAAFVAATGIGRETNRRLAALLLVESVAWGLVLFLVLAEDAVARYNAFLWWAGALLALPIFYARFLSFLDTPLVRPLKSRAVAWGLLALAIGLQALPFLRPELFAVYARLPSGEVVAAGHANVAYLLQIAGAVSLFGLAASLHAFVRAPRATPARRRAGVFLLAFGLRDLVWLFLLVFTLASAPPIDAPNPSWESTVLVSLALTTLTSVPLLAYGIVRAQLFDIDLKIKRTLKQGTVAAVFVGVFFAVSESVGLFFEDAIGGYAGIAAAALLVFALAPVQNLAQRLAERAMPHATGSSEYVAYRKLEVYRVAVESAWEDGELSPADRVILDKLARKLVIRREDALALENEVEQARARQPAALAPDARA